MQYELEINNSYIDFEAEGVNEIFQNVRTIIKTIKGTVPLDRNFGIDISFLDSPIEVAKAKMRAEVINAIRVYEPRAEIVKVVFLGDDSNGVIVAKVVIEIDEQYL